MYTVHVLGGVHATEKCIHVLSVQVAGVTTAQVPQIPNSIVFVVAWLLRPVLATFGALPKSNTRDQLLSTAYLTHIDIEKALPPNLVVPSDTAPDTPSNASAVPSYVTPSVALMVYLVAALPVSSTGCAEKAVPLSIVPCRLAWMRCASSKVHSAPCHGGGDGLGGGCGLGGSGLGGSGGDGGGGAQMVTYSWTHVSVASSATPRKPDTPAHSVGAPRQPMANHVQQAVLLPSMKVLNPSSVYVRRKPAHSAPPLPGLPVRVTLTAL